MILEMERTLTSLVPMEEIALPEEDVQEKVPLEVHIQGEEVPQGMDDQEKTLSGGALQMIWTTAIRAKMTKMKGLRMISEEIPSNISKHMGSEPDATT